MIKSLQLIRFLSAALLIGALAACGKESAAPTPSAAGPTPAAGAVALKEIQPKPELIVREVAHNPESITFTLLLPTDQKITDDTEPLIFCVPQGKAIRGRLVVASVDGRDVASESGSAAGALSVISLGVLRHWPLAAVRLNGQSIDAIRNRDGKGGALEARMELAWDGAVDPPAKPLFPAELDPKSSWLSIGKTLVADPEGLSRYQVVPTLAGAVKAEPRDIRLAPGHAEAGDAPWLRLRVAGEGLHRLDLEKLAAMKIQPSAQQRLKLFHEGKPIPLEVHEGQFYFWNEPNHSVYSRENVFWLTAEREMGPRAIGQRPAFDPDSATERNIYRRATILDQDNELVISYGPFRMIRAMRWCNSRLDSDKPTTVTLGADFPIVTPEALAEESIEVTAKFFFPLNENAPTTATAEGLQVIVTAGEKENQFSRTLTFRDNEQVSQTFRCSPRALGPQGLTFSLVKKGASPQPGIEEVWLDSIEARYWSEPRLVAGRLTIDVDDELTTHTPGPVPPLAENQISWTNLIGADYEKRAGLFVLGVHKDNSITALPQSVSKNVMFAGWPAERGMRVEVYDASFVPVESAFETPTAEDLVSKDQGTDELIVAHRDFIEGLQPLAQFHTGLGRRVRIVDVQSVYDAFNHGELSPEALRDFFAYTLTHWKRGAPSTILLVGDCNSDYLDEARKGVRNWVPTYSIHRPGRSFASDEWMALTTHDLLSDFMIGRISVNNPKDLAAIIQKQIAYESKYPFGPWRARAALVADNEPTFPRLMDDMAAHGIPPEIEIRRVYLHEFPFEDNLYAPDAMRKRTFEQEHRWMKISNSATDAILETFKSGAATMTYFGHGSPNIWATERIWLGGDSASSDNLRLRNTNLTPFVINFTCNSGAIDYLLPPWNINITEDMLRTEKGGSIAAWVPSGPGRTEVQEILGETIFSAMHHDRLRSLGEIIAVTKARFAASIRPVGSARDHLNEFIDEYVHMYVLLGDPNVHLQLTSKVFSFELPQKSYSPAEHMEAALSGVNPPQGKAVVGVDLPGMKGLRSAEINYSGGVIPIQMDLWSEAAPGDGVVRVYAWNEQQRTDMVAQAKFTLANNLVVVAEDVDEASRAPHLRLITDSLEAEPKSPSEGQTIFVKVAVENVGSLISEPARVSLYEGDPRKGGELAYNHNLAESGAPNSVSVGPIHPGNSQPVTLRWDPSFNSGEQSYWVRLESDKPSQLADGTDTLTSGTLKVRTKAKLGYRNVRAAANPEDVKAHRMFLKAEVTNEGETDARNISIAFYKGRKATEKNLIYETLLEKVPALSAVPVVYEWNFGAPENLLDGEGNSGFMIQVWIKGSRIRISSEPQEARP